MKLSISFIGSNRWARIIDTIYANRTEMKQYFMCIEAVMRRM